MNGTPRELLPIAEEVLVWVSRQKTRLHQHEQVFASAAEKGWDVGDADEALQPRRDTIRRIELCALATREAAMFFDLYGIRPHGHLDFIGGDPHGETADPQGQRSEAEGLPGAQGCR